LIHADALVTIETVNEILKTTYETKIASDNATTLAGYILELSEGELPQVGMKVHDENMEFMIAKTHGNRIDRVVIKKIED
ncbi:MAG: transporter associated domain-containing protein, partial [Candidatus Heimdallarchaeota archaeon]